MPAKLYWNTITPLLKSILVQLMNCEELKQFRLVGGTALSLQIGHRLSVDCWSWGVSAWIFLLFPSKISQALL